MRLVFLNAVLIALIAGEFALVGRSAPPEAPGAASDEALPAAAASTAVSAPSAERLEVLNNAPIFFAARSAPEPTPPAAETTADEPPPKEPAPEVEPPAPLTLLGTVVSEGVALAVVERAGQAPARAFPGDVIGGWEIVDIRPNEVVLDHGSGTQRVALERAASAREGRPVKRNYGSRGEGRSRGSSTGGGGSAGAPPARKNRARKAVGGAAANRPGVAATSAAPGRTASAQAWAAAAARRGARSTASEGEAGRQGNAENAAPSGAGESADRGADPSANQPQANSPRGQAANGRAGSPTGSASGLAAQLPADDLSLNILERFDDED